jgi:hypothetical protein
MSADLDEWVQLSIGDDRATVKDLAEAELARHGVRLGDLSDEQLRIDIGTDTDLRDFFRVRVRRSVLKG